MTKPTPPPTSDHAQDLGANRRDDQPCNGHAQGSVDPYNRWAGRCVNTPGPGQTDPHSRRSSTVDGTRPARALPSSNPRQPSPTPLTRGNA
jgi:hypothetical protein